MSKVEVTIDLHDHQKLWIRTDGEESVSLHIQGGAVVKLHEGEIWTVQQAIKFVATIIQAEANGF